MLEDDWSKEAKEIQKCIDCRYNSWITGEIDENYFTLMCAKPHLLVYIPESKRDGSRWWPAKVLAVNDNRKVTIECFGDHLRGEFNFGRCILYSDSAEDLCKKTELAKKSKIEFHKKEFESAFEVRKIDIITNSILYFLHPNAFFRSIL